MQENEFQKLKKQLFYRDNNANKGDFGKALVIGGSLSYPFAPAIAASFLDFAGPGYVCLSLPPEILPITATRVALSCVFSSDALTNLNRYSAILFGNGLEKNETNKALLGSLLQDYEGTLVIDATGIDLLKEVGFAGDNGKKTIILTPHLGEARRLLGSDLMSKEPDDFSSLAQAYVESHGVFLLLKSAHSILFGKGMKPVASSYPPTPSLAHAGSGDALAGLLTGLLAKPHPDGKTEEVILFADELFHRGAALFEKEHPIAHQDIVDYLPFLEKALR